VVFAEETERGGGGIEGGQTLDWGFVVSVVDECAHALLVLRH